MAKQLLIYESAIPVTFAHHGEMSFDPSNDYGFSSGVNAVPLMAVEIVPAAAEYAIVFTESGEDVMPVAVLGVRPEQNLYLSSDSQWEAKYVPSFIRRYPFVFAISNDQQTLTLCIDETHPGFNREGRGQKLFGADNKPTAYVEQVLAFLKEYQVQFERTRAFGRRLKELNLLEPMQAELTSPGGEKTLIGGFLAVARSRLRTLSGEALTSLAKTDELELIYMHLYSMQNFNSVKDRFLSAAGKVATPEPVSA